MNDFFDTIDTEIPSETRLAAASLVASEEPANYGLTTSEGGGFEVMPYDRFGRPIHRHPLGRLTYPSPSAAYAAIRAFEEERRAA